MDTPTTEQLTDVFRQKYGEPATAGWSPSRRWRFGYWLPADVYEATVAGLVKNGDRWLDVGGGHSIFPDNPAMARLLVGRCARVVAVDPSENVETNTFAHERVRQFLEDYHDAGRFTLATMRMVVEHVEHPEKFAAALNRLVEPGGVAVILTVNRWSPISLVSKIVPFRFHHAVKAYFWGGSKEDTFPVHYRMNTRRELRELFEAAGFTEETFLRLDDLSAFSRFRLLGTLELSFWKALSVFGIHYPEHNLLAVYRRRTDGR